MLSFCTYPIETFKGLHKSEWMETMKAAHEQYGRDFPNRDFHHEQLFAWDDCFDVLQRVLSDFPYPDFYLVFEYILHAENACRPDVILVSSDQVFVLEFKHKEYAPEADIAQADMYGRFMSTCHVASRDKEVITCLVLTKLAAEEERMDGSLHFVSERALKKLLQERIKPPSRPLDIDAWQKSLYEPDKNSLRIMVEMFEQNELPHLKTARSPKITVASTFLKNLTATAKAKKEHWLCVISGVPGAGKTLLGVQYIYEMRKLDSTYQEDNATYVSGNAPLLKVLKGQLKYPSFLMTAPSLINSHRQGQLKATKLLVFDEAQRMWSKERMKSRNRGDFSENQQIIDILSEPDWGVLIALIGEGQEIYEGEDGGIEAWVKAVPPNWNVACSPKYQEAFAACKAKTVTIEPSLHLDVSIRSQGAEQVSHFVNTLLDNDIEGAKALYQQIKEKHFRMYVSQNFQAIKNYCQKLYEGRDDKRYGCITSSKNPKNSQNYKNFKDKKEDNDVAKWFNDPPSSEKSCCKMKKARSEFDVEVLELDLPIIGWVDDLRWEDGAWVPYKKTYSGYKEEKYIPGTPDYRYRINTYRVFLTRGRDGVLIYVPPQANLMPVYEILKEVGIEELH